MSPQLQEEMEKTVRHILSKARGIEIDDFMAQDALFKRELSLIRTGFQACHIVMMRDVDVLMTALKKATNTAAYAEQAIEVFAKKHGYEKV